MRKIIMKNQEGSCDGFCHFNDCDCSLQDIKQYNAIIEENLREPIDPETGLAIEIDDIPF